MASGARHDPVVITQYLTAADVANRLRVSRARAYELLKEMPVLRVGRTVRVAESDFHAWLRRSTVVPCESTAGREAKSGGASIRANASLSRPRMRKQLTSSLPISSDETPIRAIAPRTRP